MQGQQLTCNGTRAVCEGARANFDDLVIIFCQESDKAWSGSGLVLVFVLGFVVVVVVVVVVVLCFAAAGEQPPSSKDSGSCCSKHNSKRKRGKHPTIGTIQTTSC